MTTAVSSPGVDAELEDALLDDVDADDELEADQGADLEAEEESDEAEVEPEAPGAEETAAASGGEDDSSQAGSSKRTSLAARVSKRLSTLSSRSSASRRSASSSKAGEGKSDAKGDDSASEAGQSEAAAVPAAAEKPKAKKKFEAKASPKCSLCSKSVYKTEELLDSQDRVFHKACLRCYVCKTSLGGKQQISDPEEKKLLVSQYRIDEDPDSGRVRLYCDKHGTINRRTVVKGTAGEEERAKASKDKDVLNDAALTEKNEEIRKEMEVMMGDATPLCGRCGGSLEGPGKVIVSGMERFHEVCPASVGEAKRTPRYFVKTTEARPVVSLTCDEQEGTRPITFLFQMNESSKKQALLDKGDVIAVDFDPDTEARSGTIRRLSPGHVESDSVFALSLRNEPTLSGVAPSANIYLPTLNVVLKTVARRKGKAVVAEVHRDGCIMVHTPQGQLRFLLNLDCASSTVTRTSRGDPEGPGVTITGFAKGQKADELRLDLDNNFEAFSWEQAVHQVLDQLCPDRKGPYDTSVDLLCMRLFKVSGGVLHQYVFTFVYSKTGRKIGTTEKARLFLSEWPEPSPEQAAKADPLAGLKSDLKSKRELEAAEAAAEAKRAEERAKAEAKAEAKASKKGKKSKKKGGGGGCLIM